MLPNLWTRGTAGSQRFEPMLPNLGPSSRNWQFPLVPSSRNYRFSNIRTNAFQSWNRVSAVPGTAGSQDWNQCFRCSELGIPSLGISDSETLERMLWNLKPQVPNSGKRRSPKIGGFQVPGNFRFPKVEIIMSCNLKAAQSYLREFWLPKGWAMFPSFDTSFISKNCDWKGCNLGIRLKKNFCNKPLLFCLMVRQKKVYTCILMLTQRICARPRCCMKKAAMVLFNGPASRKALVENKCCILDRHEKHVL